jgi:predicted dithiol-disulfide oxidoreductase (DUF899 family)
MPQRIVSREEWIAARKRLLEEEKQFTRLRDQLSQKRRDLPWVKVEKTYIFEGPGGPQTLSDLFEGRSQLIVKHFMLAPGQTSPCVGCSFEVDHVDGILTHLVHDDVSYVAVSRAPIAEIEEVRRRMGWRFRWVSSFGSDFNYDFNASFTKEQIANGTAFYNYEFGSPPFEEMSGRSVFCKDASGAVFHTYSSWGRGGEDVLGAYRYLDLTPKGRNENGPYHNMHDWVRLHDAYEDTASERAGVLAARKSDAREA